MNAGQKQVAILGAGLTGLLVAEALSRRGDAVVVLEREAQPGGFCRSVNIGGRRVERYYHHVFPNETPVVELLNRLDFASDLKWFRVRQGVIQNNTAKAYDNPWSYLRQALSPPTDLFFDLRFAARIGAVDLAELDRLPALAWLRRWQSRTKVERFWLPLLIKKFGPFAERISARWLAERVTTRQSSKGWMQRGETLGHLAGGFFRLTDRLAERCAKQGVTFQFGVEVQKIEVRDGRVLALDTAQGKLPAGDAVVSTLASPALAGLLENHDDEWVRIARATPYMSCRCVTLLLSRSLSPFYWLSNLDAADFAAVIEQSKFFDDGTHLIYLPQYIFPTSIEQKESAKKNAVEWLSKVFPPFNADSVSEDIVSIDAFSQPVFLAGDDRQKWQTLRPLANLLATDAYLDYPHQRRTMNAAIRRAAAVVELLG